MGALKNYFRGYAAHTKWANGVMFGSLKPVSDDDYYRVLIPGCRSIHQLLNHMIIMDELWITELRQATPRDDITSGDQILYPDRASLKEARHRIDDEIAECIEGLDDSALTSFVRYDEFGLEWPMWVEFAHVFRHQLHHRGQMSILIAFLGLEPPKLDPMFFPPRLTEQEADAMSRLAFA
jgi:uncharacterized damage-inducible protein DinB